MGRHKVLAEKSWKEKMEGRKLYNSISIFKRENSKKITTNQIRVE